MAVRFSGQAPGSPRELELMTVFEVAAFLKVSHQTVRRWITGGRLKHQRCGRQIRVYCHDLEAFLNGEYSASD